MSPLMAPGAEFVVVWAWHLPAARGAGGRSVRATAAEQATFLLAGLLVWAWVAPARPAAGGRRRAAADVDAHDAARGAAGPCAARPLRRRRPAAPTTWGPAAGRHHHAGDRHAGLPGRAGSGCVRRALGSEDGAAMRRVLLDARGAGGAGHRGCRGGGRARPLQRVGAGGASARRVLDPAHDLRELGASCARRRLRRCRRLRADGWSRSGRGTSTAACRFCHAAPGRAAHRHVRQHEAAAAACSTRWPASGSRSHLHWIVHEGVKMSGMPAWPARGRTRSGRSSPS